MPTSSCLSYPADPPLSGLYRGAVQPDLLGLPRMPGSCFSYQAGVPRRMPSGTCFSYPGAVPPDIRNRDTARPGPDGHVTGACVSYPVVPCFRY